MVALPNVLQGLVVDDDQGVRASVASVLRMAGHRVLHASDREEAIRAVTLEPVHFCIADVHVRADDGLQIVGILRRIVSRLPVIFISGDLTPDIVGRARTLGAHECLRKPLDVHLLRQAVEEMIHREILRRPHPES